MKALLLGVGAAGLCAVSWVVGYAMGIRDEKMWGALLDGIVDNGLEGRRFGADPGAPAGDRSVFKEVDFARTTWWERFRLCFYPSTVVTNDEAILVYKVMDGKKYIISIEEITIEK